MGTQDSDWVSIANSLLNRCHVDLQVTDLKQCDAHVFVSLYEAILGEKVPDFIADSHSPEDDAHNIQSVIDSLALDYLQVSLSHVTGENIVRGDTESIRNLLEIFDGLLEYLTEQISEASSQNGDDGEAYRDLQRQYEDFLKGQKEALSALRPPASLGSSDLIIPSWEVDGSESTSELIRLGDTAHTYIQRGGVTVNGFSRDQRNNITQLSQEGAPTAIPLKRPYQPKVSKPTTVSQEVQVSMSSDRHLGGSPVRSREHTTTAREVSERTSTSDKDAPPQKSPEPSYPTSPERRSQKPVPNGCSTELAQKKVAFRTQPDIRLMTLQSTRGDQGDWTIPSDGGESVEPSSPVQRVQEEPSTLGSEYSLLNSRTMDLSLADEPLSVQRARNKLSELELQEMADKLSRRLDELDQMLKKALGNKAQSSEHKEEDKLSQHSDSIMEIRRKKRLQASQSHQKPPTRPRSLSSSPVPLPHPSLQAQFEDALHKEARGEMGKIRKEVQKELDLQRLKAQMLSRAYQNELQDFQEAEQEKLSKLKDKLKDNEQEFKENILKAPPKRSHPQRVYSGKQIRTRQWAPSSHKAPGRMKVKENDLLPLLLEEFPNLQISPHAFNAMWKGQLVQVEQLARSCQDDERSERKLQREVEEAHKKHNLLTDIIQREQEHNTRLKDFKDRIRLQKSAQNKMKENRQQVARAKKYYEDYHVQLRAKLLRARTREERIFKNLYEEGLELQKRRLREMRQYTKEQREEQRKRHKDELESMENYYKDQFSMLAEAVTQERQEIQTREKAQSKNLHKIKRELRTKMEKEIQELQEMIIRTDEDAFFRELEAERLKRRLQMASFQYSKSHGL
ncbi:centrosomal protein of 95 kDa isoform X2 [Hyperolius riggenbachi]|uniref:centrosomal protein of 95 kDa isoform X2 n=1 Tax=Hyperolius riggenbachi TaxID=752182 RepID=UPI0035A3AFC9